LRKFLVIAFLFITGADAPALAQSYEQTWEGRPELFFDGYHPDIDVSFSRYGPFLQNYEQGFAISLICPGVNEQLCHYQDRRHILRLVRRKPPVNGVDQKPPYAWLQTDLASCPGSLDALRALREANWSPNMTLLLQGKQIKPGGNLRETSYEGQYDVVTADAGEAETATGARTLSGGYRFTGNPDGTGNPSDWAEKFLVTVEPCLVEATARAPWERASVAPMSARTNRGSPN
jgi:hypothetical protein